MTSQIILTQEKLDLFTRESMFRNDLQFEHSRPSASAVDICLAIICVALFFSGDDSLTLLSGFIHKVVCFGSL